jgi:hypothetical protein
MVATGCSTLPSPADAPGFTNRTFAPAGARRALGTAFPHPGLLQAPVVRSAEARPSHRAAGDRHPPASSGSRRPLTSPQLATPTSTQRPSADGACVGPHAAATCTAGSGGGAVAYSSIPRSCPHPVTAKARGHVPRACRLHERTPVTRTVVTTELGGGVVGEPAGSDLSTTPPLRAACFPLLVLARQPEWTGHDAPGPRARGRSRRGATR